LEGKTMKFLFPILFFLVSLLAQDNYENWDKQYKLTPTILDSEAHRAYIEIFTNKKATLAYINKSKSYPVGAIVYKPLYQDKAKKVLVRVVIMEKMYKGYDSANGDWFYAVSNPKGDDVYEKGRIDHCISCHKLVKDTDYMFSQSVMKKIDDENFNFERVIPDLELYEK
jgi:cytochrome P460